MLGDKAKEKHFRGSRKEFHLGKGGPALLPPVNCVGEGKAVGKIRIWFLVALRPQQLPCQAGLTERASGRFYQVTLHIFKGSCLRCAEIAVGCSGGSAWRRCRSASWRAQPRQASSPSRCSSSLVILKTATSQRYANLNSHVTASLF